MTATAPVAAARAPRSSAALAGVSRLIVAGDSLADVGTFGFKLTIQDSADPAGFPVFPDLVGAAFGLPAGCSHYVNNEAGQIVPRGDPTCTNFAVGGARILRADGPQSIPAQLRDAAASVGGVFGAGDLVLIDGGGNDAALLSAAYVVATSSRKDLIEYLAFLASQVGVKRLVSVLPGDDSLGRTTGLYMEKAADALADAVVAELLARGATHVAVMNVPDVTLTPLFRAAFDKLVQERGVDEATGIQLAVRQAVGAFNARLQARLGNDPRIALVDVRSAVDAQVANPAAVGLTDATQAACPVEGVDSAGLPDWTLQTCTSAALDAVPGTVPGWWTTWAFADGLHPTPAGHRLLAATINDALLAASP